MTVVFVVVVVVVEVVCLFLRSHLDGNTKTKVSGKVGLKEVSRSLVGGSSTLECSLKRGMSLVIGFGVFSKILLFLFLTQTYVHSRLSLCSFPSVPEMNCCFPLVVERQTFEYDAPLPLPLPFQNCLRVTTAIHLWLPNVCVKLVPKRNQMSDYFFDGTKHSKESC